jgi:hypothetical protein
MVSTTATVYVMDGIKKLNLDLIEIEKKFKIRSELREAGELEFVYDLKIVKEIERSNKLFNKNVSEVSFFFQIKLLNSILKIKQVSGLEIGQVVLKNCDKETLKSYKYNPDTFSQMCMQLAYYQLHKK